MNYGEISEKIKVHAALDGNELFDLVRSVAYFYQHSATNEEEGRDLIIRIVDKKSNFDKRVPGIGRMIDAISREAGLHPYIESSDMWRDSLAQNVMRHPAVPGKTLHLEQALVLKKLLGGSSLILSAPTSFGKSILIDAVIASKKYKTSVIVVPTIALLDEVRRRLLRRFHHHQIITTALEQRSSDFAIYIGTQERLIERTDLKRVDFFVVDEFYKLDLTRSDERSISLNAMLAKYGKSAKQIYLLGPSIDAVPNHAKFRPDLEFYKTRFTPVAADIINRYDAEPSPERLIADLYSVRNESSLIYLRSPNSAYSISYDILNSTIKYNDQFCSRLADWIAENFHPKWILSDLLRAGIGLHYGRMPRSIAQMIISLFNKGNIKQILCTSSMIEGVNTVAENVFIYDQHVSYDKIDRFTFENIKGRAGRMFRHNIGKIYLYNPPPTKENFEVNVPLFGTEDSLKPELLIQIEDKFLADNSVQRKNRISARSDLPIQILKRWADYGFDHLDNLSNYIKNTEKDDAENFFWSGYPKYPQYLAVFRAAWENLKFNKHGMKSSDQAAFYAMVLRREPNIRQYLDFFVRKEGLDAQKQIDKCLNFLRGAEHTFPQIFRMTNDVINSIYGDGSANYKIYAQQMQNYFFKIDVRTLDEIGIPVQIASKLIIPPSLETKAIIQTLQDRDSNSRRRITKFEHEILDFSLNS